MSQSITKLIDPPSGRSATSVTPAADAERPAVRTVFADGELLIDGVAVCPCCLENKGSRFCRCTAEDRLLDLDVESLRHVRAVGLVAA